MPESLVKPEDPASKFGKSSRETDAVSRKGIEAMDAVMNREKSLGFDPKDVAVEDRGYDIESRDPETGKLRFIEVKGRRADASGITITRNEMITALNAAEAYILAAVLIEDGHVHNPLYVTNPSELFGPEPKFNEESRTITAKSIKQAANASPGS